MGTEKSGAATARAYTDDMAELSGFGGGYEEACRAMVLAGLDWLDAHPNADPKYRGFQDVYGICLSDNDDAIALDKAVCAATEGATGAMHQAAISHIFWIRSHSWDEYVTESRRRRTLEK